MIMRGHEPVQRADIRTSATRSEASDDTYLLEVPDQSYNVLGFTECVTMPCLNRRSNRASGEHDEDPADRAEAR